LGFQTVFSYQGGFKSSVGQTGKNWETLKRVEYTRPQPPGRESKNLRKRTVVGRETATVRAGEPVLETRVEAKTAGIKSIKGNREKKEPPIKNMLNTKWAEN